MTRPAILVVDDESGIRNSLEEILREEGWEAASVASGEECLESCSKNDFDLVLLDVWLPGMDGLKVLESLKQRDPAPLVIMISGHGRQGDQAGRL
jgi:two-component system nitrogen regulation response regulator NtrX